MEELFSTIIEKWGAWGLVVIGLFLLYQQNNNLNDRIAEMTAKYLELTREVMDEQAENRAMVNEVIAMYQALAQVHALVMGYIEQRVRND